MCLGHTNLEDMRQGIGMFKWRKSFKKLESEGRPHIANNVSINILVSVNINLIM